MNVNVVDVFFCHISAKLVWRRLGPLRRWNWITVRCSSSSPIFSNLVALHQRHSISEHYPKSTIGVCVAMDVTSPLEREKHWKNSRCIINRLIFAVKGKVCFLIEREHWLQRSYCHRTGSALSHHVHRTSGSIETLASCLPISGAC